MAILHRNCRFFKHRLIKRVIVHTTCATLPNVESLGMVKRAAPQFSVFAPDPRADQLRRRVEELARAPPGAATNSLDDAPGMLSKPKSGDMPMLVNTLDINVYKNLCHLLLQQLARTKLAYDTLEGDYNQLRQIVGEDKAPARTKLPEEKTDGELSRRVTHEEQVDGNKAKTDPILAAPASLIAPGDGALAPLAGTRCALSPPRPLPHHLRPSTTTPPKDTPPAIVPGMAPNTRALPDTNISRPFEGLLALSPPMAPTAVPLGLADASSTSLQSLGGNDDTEHPDDLLNCLLNSPQLRMLGGATPTHKSSPFLGGAPSAASTSATLSDVLQVDQTFRRVGSWCEVAPMLA